MVGLATDMTSSVADPAAQKARRVAATKQAKKQHRPSRRTRRFRSAPAASVARPERGHLFNVKPISQQGAPLRISRLPG